MENLRKLTPIAMIVLILGAVGRMDYDDHVQMEKYKCERGGSVWVVEQNGNQYCKLGLLCRIRFMTTHQITRK